MHHAVGHRRRRCPCRFQRLNPAHGTRCRVQRRHPTKARGDIDRRPIRRNPAARPVCRVICRRCQVSSPQNLAVDRRRLYLCQRIKRENPPARHDRVRRDPHAPPVAFADIHRKQRSQPARQRRMPDPVRWPATAMRPVRIDHRSRQRNRHRPIDRFRRIARHTVTDIQPFTRQDHLLIATGRKQAQPQGRRKDRACRHGISPSYSAATSAPPSASRSASARDRIPGDTPASSMIATSVSFAATVSPDVTCNSAICSSAGIR